MDTEKIGKFIKQLRKKNNLSQKEFADLFGVTYQAVSKWERGLSIPDVTILNEISKKYHVNLEDIINGKKKKNKYIWYLIFTLILLVIIIILFLIFNKNNDFELNEITTTCENFTVTGSVASSSDKTTIIISDISYCDEDNSIYESIIASLYEKNGSIENNLSTSEEKENITISDYLENIKFKIEHITTSCQMFTSSDLYILIKAKKNGVTINYQIPLELDDNCSYVSVN